MLQLFNNTKIPALLSLVVYLLVTRMAGFIHPVAPPEDGGALYLLILDLIHKNPLVSSIIALIINFANAMLLNRIVFHRRINFHRDYFVALIYILLSGSLIAFQTISPELLGSTFIILGINILFDLAKEFEKREVDYYVGLFIGIAGLFSPHYFLFVIPTLLSIFLFGTFRLREITALLLGWINPFILAGVGYYLADGFSFFMERSFHLDYSAYSLYMNWGWNVYGIGIAFILLFMLAAFLQPTLITRQQHYAKQFIRVVYNFLFMAFGSLLFLPIDNFVVLFLLVPYLAFIFGIFFKRNNAKVTVFMELFHLIFLILVLLNHYKYFIA